MPKKSVLIAFIGVLSTFPFFTRAHAARPRIGEACPTPEEVKDAIKSANPNQLNSGSGSISVNGKSWKFTTSVDWTSGSNRTFWDIFTNKVQIHPQCNAWCNDDQKGECKTPPCGYHVDASLHCTGDSDAILYITLYRTCCKSV